MVEAVHPNSSFGSKVVFETLSNAEFIIRFGKRLVNCFKERTVLKFEDVTQPLLTHMFKLKRTCDLKRTGMDLRVHSRYRKVIPIVSPPPAPRCRSSRPLPLAASSTGMWRKHYAANQHVRREMEEISVTNGIYPQTRSSLRLLLWAINIFRSRDRKSKELQAELYTFFAKICRSRPLGYRR